MVTEGLMKLIGLHDGHMHHILLTLVLQVQDTQFLYASYNHACGCCPCTAMEMVQRHLYSAYLFFVS